MFWLKKKNKKILKKITKNEKKYPNQQDITFVLQP